MNGGVTSTLTGPTRLKMLDVRKLVPVFIVFLSVTAAFAVVDIFLVRIAHQHRAETGIRLFQRGTEANKSGRTAAALELYRSAHNQSPTNPQYHVAFAKALHTTGRTQEAQRSLERLLSAHPAYGPANAEIARIQADAGDWQNAAWYYHRALYGEWTERPDLRRLRLELAELLATNGAREELLAEVVLLDSVASQPAEERVVARLALAAGDWARAERHYRSLLRANPADEGLVVGLGRAQFGAGKYVAAERTFRRLIDSRSTDAAIQHELALVQSINDMDPTLRRLSPAEKHRRAHQLVAAMVSVLTSCSPDAAIVADAQLTLARHERVRRHLEAAEADLNLFDALWTARRSLCGDSAAIPENMRLLAAQLER